MMLANRRFVETVPAFDLPMRKASTLAAGRHYSL